MFMNRGNSSQIPQKEVLFNSEELKLISLSLSHRYRIEEVLNKFTYQERKKYTQNIKNLCQALSNILQLESKLKAKFISSFGNYISYQENVPIEVNIRKLRYEQFCSLLAEWQTSIKEPSIIRPSERLYSIQHRNILFSRVFVEEKQVIEAYFEELSEKKMLKGVDLYQLLADILSHYFLYEFVTDNETFFEKVNSFNNFLQIVQQFINSQTRIIIDNKSKDFQYIKLYEFQALIYFWETINPELQIRSSKRFSVCCKQVQTQRHEIMSIVQQGVQTINPNEKIITLDEIINDSMKSLNKLTETESDPEELEIIQNIFETLRKEKIKLAQYQKTKGTRKRSQASRHILPKNSINSHFLDVTSEQSDSVLQRTERILKGYVSPDEFRESVSKRKSANRVCLDRTVEVNEKNLIKIKAPEKEIRKKSPEKLKNVQFHSFSSQNNDMVASSSSETKPIRILANSINKTNPIIKGPTHTLQNEKLKIKTQSPQKPIYFKQSQSEIKAQKRSLLNLLEMIFSHYADKDSQLMDNNSIHRFFADIGIIAPRESIFELRPLRQNPIRNFQNFKQIQFLEIMGLIMKDDHDLTYEVISEFVDAYVKTSGAQQKRNSQARQKSEQTRNLANRSQLLMKEPNGSSQLKAQETYKGVKLRDKEANHIADKSAQKLYQKYPEPRKLLDPHSKGNASSFEREKSKEASGKKRRFVYCDQTGQNQNDSQIGKKAQFGNSINFCR